MSNKNLVIVIVNFNCADDTIECLNSLAGADLERVFIIIIDNNSKDNSVENLTAYFKNKRLAHSLYKSNEKLRFNSGNEVKTKYHFIKSEINLGFAEGNNLALKHCLESKYFNSRDHILLLNPDTIIENNTLKHFLQIERDVFISSCIIRSYDNPDTILSYGGFKINKLLGLVRPSKKNEKPDYVYGGALATNFQTVEKTGLLPSEYFLYWEETDFCTKARKKGIPLLLIDSTSILDKVGQSTGRGKLANYYFVRNSFLYFKKYYPKSIFTLFVTNILRVIHKLLKADYKSAKGMLLGINDYLKSNYGFKDFG